MLKKKKNIYVCSYFNKTGKELQHNNPNMFPAGGTVHPSGGEAAKAEEEEEEEPPIDMSWPGAKSPGKLVLYILSFPLMAPLYITLPDMKNPDYTFFPSLKVPGIGTLMTINILRFYLYSLEIAY